MWVPPEDKDPVVLHAPTRKSIACFGAVSLQSGKFVHMFSPVFNAATFETFLKALLRRRSRHKKMIVVLDNASYHRAKLLKPWLHAHRASIELLFLPPYSPQLAPVERVWRLTRRLATHNLHFNSLDDLTTAVESRFKHWRKPNPVLRRLCGIT
jgi:transposase